MLDAVAFHDEFDELYGGIDTSEGLTRMRWLATQTWRSTDDTTHHYVDMLRTYSADDWEVAYDEAHLVDWYRVLMASHLRELPAVSSPKALKDRLPLVGLDAHRGPPVRAYGRELQSLVETFGSVPVIAQIAPLLTTGSRGWLSQDDVERRARTACAASIRRRVPRRPGAGAARRGAATRCSTRPRAPRPRGAAHLRLTTRPGHDRRGRPGRPDLHVRALGAPLSPRVATHDCNPGGPTSSPSCAPGSRRTGIPT